MKNHKPVLLFKPQGRKKELSSAGWKPLAPAPFSPFIWGEKHSQSFAVSQRIRRQGQGRGEGGKGTLPLNKNKDIVGTRRAGPKRRATLTAA